MKRFISRFHQWQQPSALRLHRLTFILLQASSAAEREDLFTGLTSSDC